MIRKFLPVFIIMLIITSCAGLLRVAIEKPQIPDEIMGKGVIGDEILAAFLISNNPHASHSFVRNIARLYIDEAAYEGVNHDVAFSQMCLETGFLTFGNLVTVDQNNFCGLGATGLPGPDGNPDKGLHFPDVRTGVRAHIQHLKAYATDEPLKGALVDPRYRFVHHGSSPTIDGLSGTWAADKEYALKIRGILHRLYDFAY